VAEIAVAAWKPPDWTGVPPRSRGARRGVAPRGKKRLDLTRVCEKVSVEDASFGVLCARFRRGPGARGSDLDASDASKTRASRSIPEPQRVTRNHDFFSVARLASGSHNVPRRHACTRPKPTPPLTTMALTLPTDHFFRDAFREADDVRPSRLSRHRSPLDTPSRAPPLPSPPRRRKPL
jgi:hypothetical protein